jgi:hypothetical protein
VIPAGRRRARKGDGARLAGRAATPERLHAVPEPA